MIYSIFGTRRLALVVSYNSHNAVSFTTVMFSKRHRSTYFFEYMAMFSPIGNGIGAKLGWYYTQLTLYLDSYYELYTHCYVQFKQILEMCECLRYMPKPTLRTDGFCWTFYCGHIYNSVAFLLSLKPDSIIIKRSPMPLCD